MRILWISNIAFGPLCQMDGQRQPLSGGWIEATYKALKNSDSIELIITTVSRSKVLKMEKAGKHTFCLLPGGYPAEYDYKSRKNRTTWEHIREKFQPELIQVWGTEFTHGYLALQVMKEIPSIIYMQGVMSQIARYYLSGMSSREVFKSVTIRDIIKVDWITRRQKKYQASAIIEAKMIKISGRIIAENRWCESHCKALAPVTKVYNINLLIREDFFQYEWEISKIIPHSIMCNSGGYPIKGLHILIKALRLVVNIIPDALLFVPGEKSPYEMTWLEKCRMNGYTKYIMNLIDKLNLKTNIQFLGKVAPKEMATQMVRSNVFVMPSSIENHSSTLMEAMVVGTPCIASYVGGIPEYLIHQVNGLIYRFEEYEILASHILRIFIDPDFSNQIAKNGRTSMRKSRNSQNLSEEFINIYEDILTK
jgi:glycosyltransferase involved in cell wall biosynthesis